MRGATLGNTLYKLKAELGKSLDVTSTAEDALLYQLIETGQQDLADAYYWSFLKSRWDAFIPPGQRYTLFSALQYSGTNTGSLPDLNRPFKTEVKWNQIWQPVVYGIDEEPEFNYLDSDRGQPLDPVQRWQMADNLNFEVWPLPATPAQLRFIQNRALTTLQTGTTTPPTWNPAATLDLDDLLIVYHVAASQAMYEKKSNAQALTARIHSRLKTLLGANPIRTETITIGRGMPLDRKTIRQIPMVLVAGGTHP